MYSRYKNATYDPRDRDGFTDVSDDEYELYRYNLPPRYDGSRFRHRPEAPEEDVSVGKKASVTPEEACSSSAENSSASPANACKAAPSHVFSLSDLTPRGYEDILIICLILLISEKGESTYDVTLLLLLLLAAK